MSNAKGNGDGGVETDLSENQKSNLWLDGTPIVVFDLETTGLSWEHDSITQIAATAHYWTEEMSTENVFSAYVWPKADICQVVSNITGITVDRNNNAMFYKGKPIEFKQQSLALVDFLTWLGRISCGKQVFLAAHNCRKFDSRFLLRAMETSDLRNAFEERVAGFVDSLPCFMKKWPMEDHPELPNHRLGILVKYMLKENFNAHNAVNDVQMLVKLMLKLSRENLKEGVFSIGDARDGMVTAQMGNKNCSIGQ